MSEYCENCKKLADEVKRLGEYIDKIGKKAYEEHAKGNDRCGRLYGIAEMCRPQNVKADPTVYPNKKLNKISLDMPPRIAYNSEHV